MCFCIQFGKIYTWFENFSCFSYQSFEGGDFTLSGSPRTKKIQSNPRQQVPAVFFFSEHTVSPYQSWQVPTMVGSWALPLLWILCPWCLRMSSLYGGCKVSSWLKAFWTSVDQVLFPRYTVGRLRPHYLTLCKPDYGPDGPCRDEWNYNRWLIPVPCITKGYFRFVVEEEQTVCLGLLNGETTQSQLHEARYVSTIDVQLACQNVARKTPIPQ